MCHCYLTSLPMTKVNLGASVVGRDHGTKVEFRSKLETVEVVGHKAPGHTRHRTPLCDEHVPLLFVEQLKAPSLQIAVTGGVPLLMQRAPAGTSEGEQMPWGGGCGAGGFGAGGGG
jgi:hypothetical protein